MPKKTLRRPYNVPPTHVCHNCGNAVRKRDVLDAKAKQLDNGRFLCPYCVKNSDTIGTSAVAAPQKDTKLGEICDVRQVPGEPFRRWYKNNDIDLIVWLDGFDILGFQLVVPSGSSQIAITWRTGEGLTISDVDDGESRPFRPKMTPVLTYRQDFDAAAVLTIFKSVSDGLPAGLIEVVERKITERIRKNTGEL